MENLLTRWIVQENINDMWITWNNGRGFDYRFWSLESCKSDFEKHKNDFHYSPASYRFCKIIVQPEYIVETEILETH